LERFCFDLENFEVMPSNVLARMFLAKKHFWRENLKAIECFEQVFVGMTD
jgi:hypothetical protein